MGSRSITLADYSECIQTLQLVERIMEGIPQHRICISRSRAVTNTEARTFSELAHRAEGFVTTGSDVGDVVCEYVSEFMESSYGLDVSSVRKMELIIRRLIRYRACGELLCFSVLIITLRDRLSMFSRLSSIARL